jgi:hypothetical protein
MPAEQAIANSPAKRRSALLCRTVSSLLEGGREHIKAASVRILLVRNWWMLVMRGLIAILLGSLAFIWRAITILAMLYLVAVWAIVTGLLKDECPLLVVGWSRRYSAWSCSSARLEAALAVLWLFGAYAIVFGVLLLIFAFRLRSLIEVRQEAWTEGQGTRDPKGGTVLHLAIGLLDHRGSGRIDE